jgi:hypothetical protein
MDAGAARDRAGIAKSTSPGSRASISIAGLASERIAAIPDACTACDPARLQLSPRWIGAGRLFHFVTARVLELGADARGFPSY